MALIRCSECGNSISDKARFCPKCRCPNSLVSGANLLNNGNKTSTIEGLKVSEDLKSVFRLIAGTRVVRSFFGIPLFELKDKRLQPWFLLNKISIGSRPGFLFGPLYYFYTGMWRKGLVIALITGLPAILIAMVGGDPVNIVCAVVIFLILVMSFGMARYDRYRTLVLGEKFWW